MARGQNEVDFIFTGLKVAIILIIAIIIFNALNQSSAIQSLPDSEKEKVQNVQDNFWIGVGIIGIGGLIIVVIWIAKSGGLG